MNASKNSWKLPLACVAITLLCAGCPGVFTSPHVKDPFYFYYHHENGREIPVILVSNTYAFSFEPDTTDEERAAIAEAVPLVELRPDPPGVTLTRDVTDEELLEVLAQLNALPGVEFAEPIVIADYASAGIYCMYCGNCKRVLPAFIAEFHDSVSEGEIQALNEAYGLQGDIESTREGVVVYRLRRTVDTSYSTLEMANFYHENPLTVRAYPLFAAQCIS